MAFVKQFFYPRKKTIVWLNDLTQFGSRGCPLFLASARSILRIATIARVYICWITWRSARLSLNWPGTRPWHGNAFSSTQKWIFYVERHGDSSISPRWSDDRVVTTWLGIFVWSILSNSIEQNGSYRNVLSTKVLLDRTKRIIHNSIK